MNETLEKIKDILATGIPQGKVRSYIIGEPELVPTTLMPCIAIAPSITETNIADTGRDQHTFTISIKAIVNIKSSIGKNGMEIVGTKDIIDIMEERNSSNELEEGTVLYQMRNNLNLGTNWDIEIVGDINYGIRRDNAGQPIAIIAIMTVKVMLVKNRP